MALLAAGAGLLDRAAAIGVAAQQHGMIVLDDDGQVIRPALLWNDYGRRPRRPTCSPARRPTGWVDGCGSVPMAAFTMTKLAGWPSMSRDVAARSATVLLPHDWLTFRLTGRFVTDRGDASGTGYLSPTGGLPDLAAARSAIRSSCRVAARGGGRSGAGAARAVLGPWGGRHPHRPGGGRARVAGRHAGGRRYRGQHGRRPRRRPASRRGRRLDRHVGDGVRHQ